jgi:hypothetical protein
MKGNRHNRSFQSDMFDLFHKDKRGTGCPLTGTTGPEKKSVYSDFLIEPAPETL